MGLLSDLRVIYHMVFKPIRGRDHGERLESFYKGQAHDYDAFRQRLLKGRDELWAKLPRPEGGIWVDMGGGTAANLEYLGPDIPRLKKIYVVDLAASLLEVAAERVRRHGWQNVELVHTDATQFCPPEGFADVVTFSYSLTMIPDWFAAIDNAWRILQPGGTIGVVDFYVSRKYPPPGLCQHRWRTRWFWPCWFATDNVFLSPDHLPYLLWRFSRDYLAEHRTRVPWVPFGRVPYYVFVGRKEPAERLGTQEASQTT